MLLMLHARTRMTDARHYLYTWPNFANEGLAFRVFCSICWLSAENDADVSYSLSLLKKFSLGTLGIRLCATSACVRWLNGIY
jgi:hypothetical protein